VLKLKTHTKWPQHEIGKTQDEKSNLTALGAVESLTFRPAIDSNGFGDAGLMREWSRSER